MIFSITLSLALVAGAKAEEGQGRPFLHPLFTDHAVLQRDAPVPIWGWATPGDRIKVTFANQTVETTANDQGKWMAKLGPYPAGGPHTIKVEGPAKNVEVMDVLVGDVWVCSGQSNMEWGLSSTKNAQAEIAAADYPRIRLITVPKKVATEPQTTFEASWEVCSPKTVPEFSAVGYLFGRDLYREVNIPIGLIDSTWGGTVAEAWTSAGALEAMTDFAPALARIKEDRDRSTKDGNTRFDQRVAAWYKLHDPGSSEQPPWSDPKFDATAWKTMDLPGNWETKGYGDFDGIAWFRKEFTAPEAWEGKAAVLHLGPIDDHDTTYVNGVEVGRKDRWNEPRVYKIPAGIIKPGVNVIAVRVLDTSGLGGFGGNPDQLKLEPADGDKAEPIQLAGDWKFRESTPMNNLSTPPMAAGENPNQVTVLYNGMIAPLLPTPIKGAIWYQGESNATRAAQYRTLLPTMIKDWRASFGPGGGDFPFIIVQLANYYDRKDQPADSAWAELREAQFLTTKALPNVGLGLAIDIGEAKDIHPRNKQDVARRLALYALATSYGKDVEFSGPVYKAMEVQGSKVNLTFDHLGGGLVVKGDKLEGFAVAGEDGKFAWADATIDGDTVVVSSPTVEKPVRVRYAWADNPACNLYNHAGLPAVPFRTDPPSK